MKFVTFESNTGEATAGILSDDRIFDLAPLGYDTMLEIISDREGAAAAAYKAIAAENGIATGNARLLAPIPRPPRIFCIGLNYASHAAESQMKVQAVPTVFMKLPSSVIGPNQDVILPQNSAQPDYEVELAVVISKPGYRIAAKDWRDYTFGYSILNDISARDIQLATSQWTLGKSFPTFTPLGPVLVTSDEIADPHTLDIRLLLNGEVMQSSNTSSLIFHIPELIEYISSNTPLEAGDIISTGTPEGVGLGRTPQRWLQPGDEMNAIVEGIGELRNRTRAEAG